jgi:hypothetical protein
MYHILGFFRNFQDMFLIFCLFQQSPPVINFPMYGPCNIHLLCIMVKFWNTLLDTHRNPFNICQGRFMYVRILLPHWFYVHVSHFLHLTSKHQTGTWPMVLLHTLHNVTNNEKYSQNSNEDYLINEIKNA